MREAVERMNVATRISLVRIWTGAVRRLLTCLVVRSSESGRGYLERAGVDVTRLLR